MIGQGVALVEKATQSAPCRGTRWCAFCLLLSVRVQFVVTGAAVTLHPATTIIVIVILFFIVIVFIIVICILAVIILNDYDRPNANT